MPPCIECPRGRPPAACWSNKIKMENGGRCGPEEDGAWRGLTVGRDVLWDGVPVLETSHRAPFRRSLSLCQRLIYRVKSCFLAKVMLYMD
jgi:hypothetical protein